MEKYKRIDRKSLPTYVDFKARIKDLERRGTSALLMIATAQERINDNQEPIEELMGAVKRAGLNAGYHLRELQWVYSLVEAGIPRKKIWRAWNHRQNMHDESIKNL